MSKQETDKPVVLPLLGGAVVLSLSIGGLVYGIHIGSILAIALAVIVIMVSSMWVGFWYFLWCVINAFK